METLGNEFIQAVLDGDTNVILKVLQVLPHLIDGTDPLGRNIIHIAASQGNLELIEVMNAMAPHLVRQKDEGGNFPEDIAAMNEQSKCMEHLMKLRKLI